VTDTTRRWRLGLGVACLAAAAVVGVVGYLKLSLEPSLNHQLPYLASAGMALVVLSVLGASLVIVDQLRTDEARMQELATAIQQLADALASGIERPARREPSSETSPTSATSSASPTAPPSP
jgi:hypothetical protein